MKIMFLQFLLYFVVSLTSTAHALETDSSQVSLDYQLYTNSLGNEYTRVHFPVDENQTVLKLNTNYSVGPLMTEGTSWSDFDIRHLPIIDVSIEKYFGTGEVHPFVALQTSAEINIGEMPREPLLQAKNAIAGLSMGPANKFRASVAVIKGTGFHSKEDATGVIVSAGTSKDHFGFASSFVMEDILASTSPSKLSAGVYLGKEKSRFIIEYDKQFDKEYNPSELSFGVRQAREWNSRDVFLFSSFAYGNSAPGSAPRFNVGITFNLQKNKNKVPVEEIEEVSKEEVKEPVVVITNDGETEIVAQEVTPSPTNSEEKIPSNLIVDKETRLKNDVVGAKQSNTKQTKQKPRNTYKGNKASDNIKPEGKSGENKMPNPTQSEQTNSYELQPSAPITPESLGQLSAANSGDATLTLLLATSISSFVSVLF